MFQTRNADVFTGDERWQSLSTPDGDVFKWDAKSTYIQEPPFFVDLTREVEPIKPIHGARVLALLGDSEEKESRIIERETNQATGKAGRELPEEFRAGLDRYFEALEGSK